MSVLISRPVFDTLYKRQLDQIPLDRNVCNMVFNSRLDIPAVGCIVKALASLGRGAYMPHYVVLLERDDPVQWIVVGSNEGWVAVSEEGTLKWSEIYHTRLMKYFNARDLKEVEYLVVVAMACGLPLQRLMDNIMRCDVEPRWMYTDIIEALVSATEAMSGGRLKFEFSFSR